MNWTGCTWVTLATADAQVAQRSALITGCKPSSPHSTSPAAAVLDFTVPTGN
jgi:hypothetical protein